jgi:mono/diheme cytochrome c family protein
MRLLVKHLAPAVLLVLFLAALAVTIIASTGLYNFAADAPHSRPVASLIDFARQRSIVRFAGDIRVPDLSDPDKILKGAGNYDAMCAQCHLSPGSRATELGKGLYPLPPDLTQAAIQPGPAFWVIKHGIKASGMPAWGRSMPDEDIWNLVAFLQELPKLSAQRYREMVGQSEGHSHGANSTSDAAPANADRQKMPKAQAGHQH